MRPWAPMARPARCCGWACVPEPACAALIALTERAPERRRGTGLGCRRRRPCVPSAPAIDETLIEEKCTPAADHDPRRWPRFGKMLRQGCLLFARHANVPRPVQWLQFACGGAQP